MIARRYVVRGRVQGVGYRYFARETALRLNVRGWVRNLANGHVEIHAEADGPVLATFREALERGPSMARVTGVLEEDAPIDGAFASFVCR